MRRRGKSGSSAARSSGGENAPDDKQNHHRGEIQCLKEGTKEKPRESTYRDRGRTAHDQRRRASIHSGHRCLAVGNRPTGTRPHWGRLIWKSIGKTAVTSASSGKAMTTTV